MLIAEDSDVEAFRKRQEQNGTGAERLTTAQPAQAPFRGKPPEQNAGLDHVPESNLVRPDRELIVRPGQNLAHDATEAIEAVLMKLATTAAQREKLYNAIAVLNVL